MIKKPEDLFGNIGSVRTRYWKVGEQGSSVLFIHGIVSSMEDWLQNIHPLAKKHRIFAVDIPGHGYTDKPDAPYTFEYFADFINDFLTFQNLDTVSLVGNSLGGGIALQFAHQFPQKINKIILVSSAGFGKDVSIIFRLIGVPIIGPLLIRTNPKEPDSKIARYQQSSPCRDEKIQHHIWPAIAIREAGYGNPFLNNMSRSYCLG